MEQDMISIYTKILQKNGIDEEIENVKILDSSSLAGAHLGSKCEYVQVSFKNLGKENLELFVKQPICMTDPIQTQMFVQIMLKEGVFLTQFVNEMKYFCKTQIGDTGLVDGMFPETLHAGADMIVLENLAQRGYMMIDRQVLQNMDQAKVVLRSLSKLHSISKILVENAGGVGAFLEEYPTIAEALFCLEAEKIMSEMFEGTFVLLYKIIEASDIEEAKDAAIFLAPYLNSAMKSMEKALNTESLLMCVNHGDCWNNNMMFSKNKDQVTFVDLQVNRIASPTADIGYYFFTSLQIPVLDQWKTLLQSYYQEFKFCSLKLGHPITFTYEELVKDFAIKSDFGFLFGLFLAVATLGMKKQDAGADTFETGRFEAAITAYVEANHDKVSEVVKFVIQTIKIYQEIKTYC